MLNVVIKPISNRFNRLKQSTNCGTYLLQSTYILPVLASENYSFLEEIVRNNELRVSVKLVIGIISNNNSSVSHLLDRNN